MSIHRYTSPDAQAASEACGRHIVGLLEETLAGQEFATLAVSGGTTPRLLFDRLAATRFHWERIHLFWVDERCVPPNDPASNFRLANEHLIQPAHIPGRNVHRIAGELAPKIAAAQYVTDIREFFGLDDNEPPHFDVIHLGMGPDAHVASLFPGQPLIDDREGVAAPVFAPQFNQWRVTLLPAALLAAKHAVFLSAGDDKADAIRAVFEDEYDPKKYPAQMVSHHGRGVVWFLDDAAAKLLT
jgi:6-phosphogluconolactonase